MSLHLLTEQYISQRICTFCCTFFHSGYIIVLIGLTHISLEVASQQLLLFIYARISCHEKRQCNGNKTAKSFGELDALSSTKFIILVTTNSPLVIVQFHSSLYFLKNLICQVNNHPSYVLCNVFRTDLSGRNFAYSSDSQLHSVKWLHFNNQTKLATTINRSRNDNCHVVAIMFILFYIRPSFAMI